MWHMHTSDRTRINALTSRSRAAGGCLGLLAVGALLMAACGGSSGNGIAGDSAKQIVDTVSKTVTSAKSVRIAGSGTDSGKTISLDLVTFSNGNLDGEITENGSKLQIVKIGSTDYIKAPKTFWSAEGAPASTSALLGGVWISGPNSQFQLGNGFSMSSLASKLKHPSGKISTGGTSTIQGQSAKSLHDTKGSTLWVATTGTAYPIEETQTGSEAEHITFSDWNTASQPKAPSGAKPISSFSS